MFGELDPVDRLVARARQLATLQAVLLKDLVGRTFHVKAEPP